MFIELLSCYSLTHSAFTKLPLKSNSILSVSSNFSAPALDDAQSEWKFAVIAVFVPLRHNYHNFWDMTRTSLPTLCWLKIKIFFACVSHLFQLLLTCATHITHLRAFFSAPFLSIQSNNLFDCHLDMWQLSLKNDLNIGNFIPRCRSERILKGVEAMIAVVKFFFLFIFS